MKTVTVTFTNTESVCIEKVANAFSITPEALIQEMVRTYLEARQILREVANARNDGKPEMS